MKIGILGNGQLGQMMQKSVADLVDIDISLYDTRAHNDQALTEFLASVDRVGYETENIASDIVAQLDSIAERVYPSLKALKTFQNRLLEKNALRQAGIATADFCAVNSLDDLHQAIATLGLPIVLKTTTEGYDGKGQYVLRSAADAEPAWQAIGDRELIAEAFVDFLREISIIACRDQQGQMEIWPMTENIHYQGILRYSLYPIENLTEAKQQLAERYIRQLAESMDYVGTITLELFETSEGLIANEVAPRVHNSGHWSIEGAQTSQFRNHILAISGRSLGSTAAIYPAVAMINAISSEAPATQAQALPQAHYHSYQKEARPNRKLGHCTLTAASVSERNQLLKQLNDFIPADVQH